MRMNQRLPVFKFQECIRNFVEEFFDLASKIVQLLLSRKKRPRTQCAYSCSLQGFAQRKEAHVNHQEP
jgi:hypothetical protein